MRLCNSWAALTHMIRRKFKGWAIQGVKCLIFRGRRRTVCLTLTFHRHRIGGLFVPILRSKSEAYANTSKKNEP